MLVLTRRVGEKLVIGNEVIVEVISVSGEGVRLGISAPRQTSVHRFEVFDEIQAANRAASASSRTDERSSIEDIAARLRKGKKDEDDG
jgi:carbon storage regulator